MAGGFDYGLFEQEAIKRLYAGEDLIGENGIFKELIQRIVNAALRGEVKGQINEDAESGIKNRKNGTLKKDIKTQFGPVEIETPRDRAGNYEPQLVGKWDRKLGTGLNDQILLLYANGNSYTDIQFQLRQLYGIEYSVATISEVTDSVYKELSDWQQRQLKSMYSVLFLDGIYFSTREGGKAQKKVIYSVYSIDCDGNRDVLGIYLRESEGAGEWGRILQDIKGRGVEDVLFVCVDGLKGFKESIEAVFPNSTVQRCIVHTIRSSTRFVADKDIRKVCGSLKKIYRASDRDHAEIALQAFKLEWDTKYPEISKAWEKDWDELMNFMDYGENLRRIIYTTNAVEALHRQIRKTTKTKGSWTNDKSLIKQIYLILTYGKGGWKRSVQSWTLIARELVERFGERFTQHLY